MKQFRAPALAGVGQAARVLLEWRRGVGPPGRVVAVGKPGGAGV